MKESLLWKHLKPELHKRGKFQKLSDRFTPGVPDVLGCFASRGIAIELKELGGVRVVKTKFRPGQLDWLEDWYDAGGASWIVSTWSNVAFVHPRTAGPLLEHGMTPNEVYEEAVLNFTKTRTSSWEHFVDQLLSLERV